MVFCVAATRIVSRIQNFSESTIAFAVSFDRYKLRAIAHTNIHNFFDCQTGLSAIKILVDAMKLTEPGLQDSEVKQMPKL